MIKIAVVIPFYNRVELLKTTLLSVQKQTILADEVIVVDDGSESNNHKKAQQLINEFKALNISLVKKLNGGTGSARNYGYKKSVSSYVIFLDSDDLILPERIESDKKILNQHAFDMLFGPSYTFSSDENNLKFMSSQHQRNIKYLKNNRAENMIMMRLHLASPNVATISRKLFDDLNGFDEEIIYSEDYDFWIRLFMHNPIIHYRNEAMSAYRFSIDHRSKSKQYEKKVLSRLKINEKFFSKNTKFYHLKDSAFSILFQTLANDYWADKNYDKFRFYFKKAFEYGLFNLSAKTFLRFIKSFFK